MSTTVTRLLTAEEFFDFCGRPENMDRIFELERGEVVELNRPGVRHGAVCANVIRILWNFARRRGRGYVVGNNAGLIVERGPDTVNAPDAFFYDEIAAFDELPVQYPEKLPALIVEVLSPSDRFSKVARRVTRFLDRGVPLVWVIDPEGRDVTVYRAGQPVVVVEEDGELTGQDVLPDLRLPVAELFQLPGSPTASVGNGV